MVKLRTQWWMDNGISQYVSVGDKHHINGKWWVWQKMWQPLNYMSETNNYCETISFVFSTNVYNILQPIWASSIEITWNDNQEEPLSLDFPLNFHITTVHVRVWIKVDKKRHFRMFLYILFFKIFIIFLKKHLRAQ